MELSLSIESFPLSEETAADMEALLERFETDYRTVMGAGIWRSSEVSGFAVVAYTGEEELKGFAAAVDIAGLNQYEWSVLVSPDIRRQSVGSALADGIRHGLQQRGAAGELAACIETEEGAAFMQRLNYSESFREMMLEAPVLSEPAPLSAGLTISPYNGESAALEKVLISAFDESILPVLSYNIQSPDRELWVMRRDDRVIASAATLEEEGHLWVTAFGVDRAEQGNGYGQAFLRWCRQLAGERRLDGVRLDVETANEAIRVYEKAGFRTVQTVSYWQPEK